MVTGDLMPVGKEYSIEWDYDPVLTNWESGDAKCMTNMHEIFLQSIWTILIFSNNTFFYYSRLSKA